MIKILWNLLLFNMINITYSLKLTNTQIINFKTYDNMKKCDLDIYKNKTIYTFNYDCDCFTFYDDNKCLEKINMSNIFYKNNLSKCFFDNMTYNSCYICNNKIFNVNYDLENTLCYSHIIMFLVFVIILFLFLFIFIIRITNKYQNKKNIIFIKKHTDYNSIN